MEEHFPGDAGPPGHRQDDPSAQPSAGDANPQWGDLVERIRSGDQASVEELYAIFGRGIRYYLCRHLGSQELDDKVHDTFVIVLQAIRNGSLREPDRLMGFVRTVVRRQVASFIEEAVQLRKDQAGLEIGSSVPDGGVSPERRVIDDERARIMYDILKGISLRDREILTRFYLYEQSVEQICTEMSLSETQFRLLKSRAKARFGELGRKRITRGPALGNFLRKATGAGH